MISDPGDPEFRFPQPGERYWHVHWRTWCTIEPLCELASLTPADEVLVHLDDRGERAIVKLKSLEPKG